MDDAALTQGVRISPEALLVAMPDGRSWLMNVSSSALTALPVSAVAAEHATLAASLVEGAISAGLAEAGPAPATEPSAASFASSAIHIAKPSAEKRSLSCVSVCWSASGL